MKRFKVFISLCILLLFAAVPVNALTTTTYSTLNSISTVSPAGSPTGTTVTVTITGTNFTTTTGSVWLEKSGVSKIDAQSISSWTNGNTIVCVFKISSTRDPGAWNVVVRTGFDPNAYIVKENAFTITEKMTLTSINPKVGRMGNDVDFTLKGTNFDEDIINKVYLYKNGNDNITDDNVDVKSSTELQGTFDLNDAEEDTYKVCIEDTSGIVECDLSFEVSTNKVGSIDISSSPSGASIFLDGLANGTTPAILDDVLEGSHKVILRKSGYEEWGKTVTVYDGETSEIDAKLYATATAAQTTNPTPVPTTAPRTTRTTVKSTIKVPTTYAEVPTTTTASPLDPLIVIGAAGLGIGLVVIRRR